MDEVAWLFCDDEDWCCYDGDRDHLSDVEIRVYNKVVHEVESRKLRNNGWEVIRNNMWI